MSKPKKLTKLANLFARSKETNDDSQKGSNRDTFNPEWLACLDARFSDSQRQVLLQDFYHFTTSRRLDETLLIQFVKAAHCYVLVEPSVVESRCLVLKLVDEVLSYDRPLTVEVFSALIASFRGHSVLEKSSSSSSTSPKFASSLEELGLKFAVFVKLCVGGKVVDNFEDQFCAIVNQFLNDFLLLKASDDSFVRLFDLLRIGIETNLGKFGISDLQQMVASICTFCSHYWRQYDIVVIQALCVLSTLADYSVFNSIGPCDFVITKLSEICGSSGSGNNPNLAVTKSCLDIIIKLGRSDLRCQIVRFMCNSLETQCLNENITVGIIYALWNILWSESSTDNFAFRVPERSQSISDHWSSDFGSLCATFDLYVTSMVLPVFVKALANERSARAAHEISFAMLNLVANQWRRLDFTDWTNVLKIVDRLLTVGGVTKSDSSNPRDLKGVEVLLSIEQLHFNFHDNVQPSETGGDTNVIGFSGSVETLVAIMEKATRHLPESSIENIVTYRAGEIGPFNTQWANTLKALMDKYYVKERRTNVRLRALLMLQKIYNQHYLIFSDQLVEYGIKPLIVNIDTESDFAVLEQLSSLLVDVCKECTHIHFGDILAALNNVVVRALPDHMNVRKLQDCEQYCDYLSTCISSLIELAEVKWGSPNPHQCIQIFELLMNHVIGQYQSKFHELNLKNKSEKRDSLKGAEIRTEKPPSAASPRKSRKLVLDWLCSFKSVKFSRVAIDTNATGGPVTNYFLALRQNVQSRDDVSPDDSASTSNAQSRVVKILPFSFDLALKALSLCFSTEGHWSIIKTVLQTMSNLMNANRELILSCDKEVLINFATHLCHLADRRRIDSLDNKQLRDSEVFNELQPGLTALISYHFYLDRATCKLLVSTIHSGILSESSSTLVHASLVCLYELPDLVKTMLKQQVLRNFENLQVNATFALALLDYYLSLVQCTDLLTGFTEKDYLGIFRTLIPLTRLANFTPFIVRLAYRAIFVWFMRAPLVWRPSIARLLIVHLTRSIEWSNSVPFDRSDQGVSCTDLDKVDDEKTKLAQVNRHACTTLLHFLAIHTYSDSALVTDEKSCVWLFGEGTDDPCLKRSHWLYGNKVISIRCVSREKSKSCIYCGDAGAVTDGSTFSADGRKLSTAKDGDIPSISDDVRDRRRWYTSTGAPGQQLKPTRNIPADLITLSSADGKHCRDDSYVRSDQMSRKRVASLTCNDAKSQTVIDKLKRDRLLDWRNLKCSCTFASWAEIVIRHPWGTRCYAIHSPQLIDFLNPNIDSSIATSNNSDANLLRTLKNDRLSMPNMRSKDQSRVDDADLVSFNENDLCDIDDIERHGSVNIMVGGGDVEAARGVSQKLKIQRFASMGTTEKPTYLTRARTATLENGGNIGRYKRKKSGSLDQLTMMPNLKASLQECFSSNSSSTTSMHTEELLKHLPENIIALMNENQLMLELIANVSQHGSGCSPEGTTPYRVDNADITSTLNVLDRMAPWEIYKAGVVYVGPNQKSEREFLANRSGSLRYENFISALGESVWLKGKMNQNMGGLDTRRGTDGNCTLLWQDSVSRLIFHVATFMHSVDENGLATSVEPNKADLANQKKRHIGNDFVCIVYNDSGLEYKLDCITSKFNYVAVVLVPLSPDMLQITLKARDEVSRWLCFKQVVVSDAAAPALCRNLAMKAECAAKIWDTQIEKKKEPPMWNAVERLCLIERLYDRVDSGQKTSNCSFLNYTTDLMQTRHDKSDNYLRNSVI